MQASDVRGLTREALTHAYVDLTKKFTNELDRRVCRFVFKQVYYNNKNDMVFSLLIFFFLFALIGWAAVPHSGQDVLLNKNTKQTVFSFILC